MQGRYFISHGGLSDSCETSACADLDACPVGSYRAGCEVTSQGLCTPCTTKAEGTEYYTSHGGLADACPTAACDSLMCAAGSIRTGRCGDDATRSNNFYACEPCQPGTFHDAVKGTCEPCAASEYQDEASKTSCKACSAEVDCAIGQYRFGCGSGSAGSCSPCTAAPGRYFTSAGVIATVTVSLGSSDFEADARRRRIGPLTLS